MAILDAKKRKALSPEQYAIPSEKKYPIEDAAHARAALARVAANGTPAQQSQVRDAVHKHFPDMALKNKPSGKG